jgi:hypothetical protein
VIESEVTEDTLKGVEIDGEMKEEDTEEGIN